MNRIWWNQVTNAMRFVSHITEALLDEKSIIVKHASSIPWNDEFEQTIKTSVMEQNSEKRFENVQNDQEYNKQMGGGSNDCMSMCITWCCINMMCNGCCR